MVNSNRIVCGQCACLPPWLILATLTFFSLFVIAATSPSAELVSRSTACASSKGYLGRWCQNWPWAPALAPAQVGWPEPSSALWHWCLQYLESAAFPRRPVLSWPAELVSGPARQHTSRVKNSILELKQAVARSGTRPHRRRAETNLVIVSEMAC